MERTWKILNKFETVNFQFAGTTNPKISIKVHHILVPETHQKAWQTKLSNRTNEYVTTWGLPNLICIFSPFPFDLCGGLLAMSGTLFSFQISAVSFHPSEQ